MDKVAARTRGKEIDLTVRYEDYAAATRSASILSTIGHLLPTWITVPRPLENQCCIASPSVSNPMPLISMVMIAPQLLFRAFFMAFRSAPLHHRLHFETSFDRTRLARAIRKCGKSG